MKQTIKPGDIVRIKQKDELLPILHKSTNNFTIEWVLSRYSNEPFMVLSNNNSYLKVKNFYTNNELNFSVRTTWVYKDEELKDIESIYGDMVYAY